MQWFRISEWFNFYSYSVISLKLQPPYHVQIMLFLCSLISLANHYFWKWTPVPGMVSVERGSTVVRGNTVSSLESGDRIRIGHDFETVVVTDDEDGGDESVFKIKDGWKSGSACEFWKLDLMNIVIVLSPLFMLCHSQRPTHR